jgi:hypothetical protein
MTKLISDAITPVYLAGTGATADDEPEVALLERLLELSLATIRKYLDARIAAGAKAVGVCEPAANKVYFSPNQLAGSYDILDRYVMKFSLGSSRRLWADAALVPKSSVLYGNLPTKQFYSDALSVAQVRQLADGLVRRMREAGHPFILGSECDVLSVPGCERTIRAKVEEFRRAV